MVPTAFSWLNRLTWQALVWFTSKFDCSRLQMMYLARVPSLQTTSNSKLAVLLKTSNQKSQSKSLLKSHQGLLCAKTPILALSLATLNLSTQAGVSARWKTRNFNFPYSAEQQVILRVIEPLFSLWLLMMSLVMACAEPAWVKKGFTSYLQSPTTASLSLSSRMSREGSSGTSIRKTSLMGFPERAGAVLHLAICPREMWQVSSDQTEGTVKLSMRMQRQPLRTGCWGELSCMFKLQGIDRTSY